MKIGLIARKDHTGLAVQTSEFWENMQPHKTLVIHPTWAGAPPEGDAITYDERFGEVLHMESKPYPESAMVDDPHIDPFLDDLDVVFTCETPYNFRIFQRAKERGIKTALQFNYEFLEYLLPSKMPRPDLFIAPSLWRFEDVPFRNKIYLPVPVNRKKLPYRRREKLETLLHTAGTGAMYDRNGTEIMRQAMDLLPASVDVMLRIYGQPGTAGAGYAGQDSDRVEVFRSTAKTYDELYMGREDAFFIPRKFGGLCLPLNEASACGMPVIMTDMAPQNSLLPSEALLPVTRQAEFMARSMIEVWTTTPLMVAERIEKLYYNPYLVAELSDASNAYAESISWDKMRSKYLDAFARIL